MDISSPPAERLARSRLPTGQEITADWVPLELPRLCEFIRTQLGEGTYPQLVLRLGRVIQIAVRVRLPARALFSGGEHLSSSHG